MRRPRYALALLVALAAGCTNNPYPGEDDSLKVRYRASPVPPKTLDPAVSYSINEHRITASVYETLVEYHYLKRPYTLIPGLAREVPRPRTLEDGRVAYRFRLREGLLYQDDPAFEHITGRPTREVVAGDVAFELMRLADPDVVSPIAPNLAKIEGFRAFGQRLKGLRAADPQFAALRIDRQYQSAGGIPGVVVRGSYELEILLSERNPQLLFWFAMPFTAPVPWEAVAYWDGRDGREFFKDHPVGSGPFKVAYFDKHRRIVLERNQNWYGILHPEWRAPGATYPEPDELGADAATRVDPDYAGRPLPFLDRIEFRIERELIPQFSKFTQGYYDQSEINKESFDRVIHEGGLSPEMAARGVRLETAVFPDVWYVGFNMLDPVVGAPAGEGGRKLRQAMSLAVDSREFTRLFYNGRGIPAQSPIPPGLFGYEPDYANPYRQPDLARARELLAEAGYPDGIDPSTAKPLKLTFDALRPETARLLQFQFLTNAWGRLGLHVEIAATTYNEFRDKVARGAHQIYMWGWIADYPDPENFLFLLWGPNEHTKSGGPNHTNFRDSRYDALFVEMRDRSDDARRLELIRQMRAILERERPWIEIYHREKYMLRHSWLSNARLAGVVIPEDKYVDVHPTERNRLRAEWNRPILWPAYALGLVAFAVALPAVVVFFRERQ
jgi:oligopeptide transport system substrate-binding protein